MTNFYIWGSQGRLGRSIQAEAVTRNKHYKILEPQDINPPFQTLRRKISPKSLFLDVSLPEGTHALCQALESALEGETGVSLSLVIGATGHNEAQLESIRKLARGASVVLCPNFSRGIFIFQQILKAKTDLGVSVSQLFNMLGFDLGLLDVHHKMKQDCPSGTALLLAHAAQIPASAISSLRMGHVVGDHELFLSGESETLYIKHTAHSRQLFAQGALWVVEQLQRKPLPVGLHSMDSVIAHSLSVKNS